MEILISSPDSLSPPRAGSPLGVDAYRVGIPAHVVGEWIIDVDPAGPAGRKITEGELHDFRCMLMGRSPTGAVNSDGPPEAKWKSEMQRHCSTATRLPPDAATTACTGVQARPHAHTHTLHVTRLSLHQLLSTAAELGWRALLYHEDSSVCGGQPPCSSVRNGFTHAALRSSSSMPSTLPPGMPDSGPRAA